MDGGGDKTLKISDLTLLANDSSPTPLCNTTI
jgi:hypothetical protein